MSSYRFVRSGLLKALADIFGANLDWQERAACRKLSQEDKDRLFFPLEPEGDKYTKAAKAICRSCPVRNECLDFFMELEGSKAPGGRWNIGGGKTAWERAQLARSRRREQQVKKS